MGVACWLTMRVWHVKATRYTRCDLVANDLVASYGIDSSSILYDLSYATYDFVMHTAIYRSYHGYATKSHSNAGPIVWAWRVSNVGVVITELLMSWEEKKRVMMREKGWAGEDE